MGFDPAKRAELCERLEQLGGVAAAPYPVVAHHVFFDGNHDNTSIGGNLTEHPGAQAFRRLFDRILEQPEAEAIFIEVRLVDEDGWPFAKRAFVLTSAPPHRVEGWFAPLQPAAVEPADWSEPPPGGMAPEGRSVYAIRWA